MLGLLDGGVADRRHPRQLAAAVGASSYGVDPRLGCDVDAWETTYQHILDPGDRGETVLEWTRGTALLPVFDVLRDEGERADFLASYGRALLRAYPRQPFGTVLAFRRIFAVAHKQEG
jgi:trans-aconitate 2-methyltransferase